MGFKPWRSLILNVFKDENVQTCNADWVRDSWIPSAHHKLNSVQDWKWPLATYTHPTFVFPCLAKNGLFGVFEASVALSLHYVKQCETNFEMFVKNVYNWRQYSAQPLPILCFLAIHRSKNLSTKIAVSGFCAVCSLLKYAAHISVSGFLRHYQIWGCFFVWHPISGNLSFNLLRIMRITIFITVTFSFQKALICLFSVAEKWCTLVVGLRYPTTVLKLQNPKYSRYQQFPSFHGLKYPWQDFVRYYILFYLSSAFTIPF